MKSILRLNNTFFFYFRNIDINNIFTFFILCREEVDKIHDQAQWKLEIEEELEEMKEEHEEEYEHKRASYEQQMKELKKQRDAKVEKNNGTSREYLHTKFSINF